MVIEGGSDMVHVEEILQGEIKVCINRDKIRMMRRAIEMLPFIMPRKGIMMHIGSSQDWV
jgi:hypothetical protein